MWSFARVAIPLLVAAATPATIFAVGVYAENTIYGRNLESALGWWLYMFTLALFHAVILGLPIYFLVRYFNLTAWWMSLFCGGLIGLVPQLLLNSAENPQYLRLACIGGFYGVCGGFAAWVTWYCIDRRTAVSHPAA